MTPQIIDIRDKLPLKDWHIGVRQVTRFITLHYNGPVVAASRQYGDGLIAQLRGDAVYQMRPGGLGAKDGGDGLQYHYVIGSEPQIYQCRDDSAKLWHCAHAVGNAESISIHVPIGLFQTISDSHWLAITDLLDYLIARYGLAGRNIVRGHLEWSTNLCPGLHLMGRLKAWRAAAAPAPFSVPFTYYTVKKNLAIVRQAPDPSAPVVLTLYEKTPEATIGIRETVKGTPAGNGLSRSDKWLHLYDQRGFIHASAMQKVA